MDSPPPSSPAAASAEDCCVKVAVHVRPLIADERAQGCKDCVTVVQGKPQFNTYKFHNSITMEKLPRPGTDASIRATFRLILNASESTSTEEVVGKYVILEPFDLPGMVLVQNGKGDSLAVESYGGGDGSSHFRVVSSLDGAYGTVSLQSASDVECFVYSGVDYKAGTGLKLRCDKEPAGPEFHRGASFMLNKGLSSYHPVSFVAKGAKRNFLLAPLLSFRDESYSTYFNFQA